MHLLDLIFPKRCVQCGRLGAYFCKNCRLTVQTIQQNQAICPVCERLAIDGQTHPGCRSSTSLDGLTSFFRYDGGVKKTIHALKYRFVSDVVREFVSIVPEYSLYEITKQLEYLNTSHNLELAGEHRSFLIPIPLHILRLRMRGFNQSEELGSLLANRLGIPMGIDMLIRSRASQPQVSMHNKADRLRNMHGVFMVRAPCIKQLKKSIVVLFDDVFTTGATMREAAKTLKKVGVSWVWAVTMAR